MIILVEGKEAVLAGGVEVTKEKGCVAAAVDGMLQTSPLLWVPWLAL